MWITHLTDLYADADTDSTSLDPNRYFRVYECRVEGGKLWIRGEKTIWFNASSCQFWSEKEVMEFRKEMES